MSETETWELAWKVTVIFWSIPIIVFMIGYTSAEVYSRLKKKWREALRR